MPSTKRGHPSSSSAGATQDVSAELAAAVDAIDPWRWSVHERVAELNSEYAAGRAREEWSAVRQRRAWAGDQSLFAPLDEPDERTATIPLSNQTLPVDEMGRHMDHSAVRDDIADQEFDKFGAPSDDTGGTSTSSDAPWGVDARIPEDFAATEIESGMDARDIKEIGRTRGGDIDWVSVCAALGCSEDDIGHVAAMCDDATVNTAWRRVALGRSSVQHITASSSNGAPYTRSLGRSLEQAVVTLIAMSWRHPMQHRCVRRLPDDFRDPDTDHA